MANSTVAAELATMRELRKFGSEAAARVADRGRKNRPATTAITPIGTLRAYTHRHPRVLTIKAPTVGPRASPTAWAAAWTPRACRSLPGGAQPVTSATLLA